MTDNYVDRAMRDAGVNQYDGRGLMPLAEARRLVESATEFRKGQPLGPSGVLESDRLWAALLSLEDASEFVGEASRLRWCFHPRGKENIAPLQRYGEGILPWLQQFIRPDGRFVNVPWCVAPCLHAIGRQDIFDVLWPVTTVVGASEYGGPGPFASDNTGEAEPPDANVAAPLEADPSADALVVTWLCTHEQLGFPLLAKLAREGDGRAQRLLRSLAVGRPSATFACVAASLGEQVACEAFAAARAPKVLDEDSILTRCDAALASGDWPELFASEPENAYHAMRLVAARERAGDAWGILFERVQGDCDDSAKLVRWCVGSNVRSGPEWTDDGLWFGEADGDLCERESPYDLEGAIVTGKAGAVTLRANALERLDLRPQLATAKYVDDVRFSLLLRAYLAHFPDAFWSDPRDVVTSLQVTNPNVLIVSASFEHCVGPNGPPSYPDTWRLRPSESPVFRSLARAIVARDGSLFEPGPSNLDFRLHAFAPFWGDFGNAN